MNLQAGNEKENGWYPFVKEELLKEVLNIRADGCRDAEQREADVMKNVDITTPASGTSRRGAAGGRSNGIFLSTERTEITQKHNVPTRLHQLVNRRENKKSHLNATGVTVLAPEPSRDSATVVRESGFRVARLFLNDCGFTEDLFFNAGLFLDPATEPTAALGSSTWSGRGQAWEKIWNGDPIVRRLRRELCRPGHARNSLTCY
ncbi:unnamed protein product, partial [Amoebophrya sp. A120]|eukprot:GSA120T00017089001.1